MGGDRVGGSLGEEGLATSGWRSAGGAREVSAARCQRRPPTLGSSQSTGAPGVGEHHHVVVGVVSVAAAGAGAGAGAG